MKLSEACIEILQQLSNLVKQIEPEDFSRPCESLSQASIGQHLRHTLEFFICLEEGDARGVINYDNRNHDKLLETDLDMVLHTINRTTEFVKSLRSDKKLQLQVSYNPASEEYVSIETTILRELVYNIEHAVHHMAMIKIGVHEAAPYLVLSSDFGVAVSTIRHKQQTAAYYSTNG